MIIDIIKNTAVIEIRSGVVGPRGQDGAAGRGIAAGGTSGQALIKTSSTDYDTGWRTLAIADISNLQNSLDGKLSSNDPSVTNARAPTGNAGGVLSGTYPNPGFAVDMATQAELDAVAAAKANIIAGTAGVAEQVEIAFSGSDLATLLPGGYYLTLFDEAGSIGVWWNNGTNSQPSEPHDRWISVNVAELSDDASVIAATCSALSGDAAFAEAHVTGSTIHYTLAYQGSVANASAGNTGFSVSIIVEGVDATSAALAAYDGSNLLNVAPAIHTHSQSDITGLVSTLGAKADLVGGVIPTSQIPAIAITDFLDAVSSQSAMLALTGQKGDWCNRTDTSTAWVIIGNDPTQLSSWGQINYPASPVTSVNGQVGVIVLGKSDVGLGNVDNTSDVNKPVSTAQQTALNLKQDHATTLDTLAAGFGTLLGPGIIRWNGTDYERLLSPLGVSYGGTGMSLYALGSVLVVGNTGLTQLSGNTSTATKYLTSTGNGTTAQTPSFTALPAEFMVACSDEVTALTTGTAKITFRMPFAMTVTAVRLSVNSSPSGSAIIVDVKQAGTSIFSAKPQIDAGSLTSVGGSVPGVISTSSLTDDAQITINIDQVGSSIAGKGLKVTIIGTR